MNDPKRGLNQNMRDVDRERSRLERDKQKQLALVKQLALKGDHTQAKMIAKEISRIDTQIKAMGNFNCQIKGVQSKVAGANSMNVMANAMGTTGQVLSKANERLDMQKISQNANMFQKQDMKLNMKQEMLDDVFDSMGGEYDNVDEGLYDQVLNEAYGKAKPQQEKIKVKPLHDDQEIENMMNDLLKEEGKHVANQQQQEKKREKYANY